MSEDASHFNDPKFDSRNFDPLKPKVQPGMSFEEHQRIVAAVLRKMGKTEDRVTDIQQLVRGLRQHIMGVRNYADLISKEHIGQVLNRELLQGEVATKYLNILCHYDKDELMILFAHFLTELTMNDV